MYDSSLNISINKYSTIILSLQTIALGNESLSLFFFFRPTKKAAEIQGKEIRRYDTGDNL